MYSYRTNFIQSESYWKELWNQPISEILYLESSVVEFFIRFCFFSPQQVNLRSWFCHSNDCNKTNNFFINICVSRKNWSSVEVVWGPGDGACSDYIHKQALTLTPATIRNMVYLIRNNNVTSPPLPNKHNTDNLYFDDSLSTFRCNLHCYGLTW